MHQDLTDLANRWILLQHTDRNSLEYDQRFEASVEIDQLTSKAPALAWEFIKAVLARSDSELITFSLAAGPIEDLLMRHPVETVECIERDISSSPMLAKALHGVWRNDLQAELWERVVVARDSHGHVA